MKRKLFEGAELLNNPNIIISLISSLIQQEWSLLDSYQSTITSFEFNATPCNTEALKDIISDIYLHIGQLESLIQGCASEAGGLEGHTAPVDEPISESFMYDNHYKPERPLHAIIVGPQYRTNNTPDEFHYEIDLDNKIYTKVYKNTYLCSGLRIKPVVFASMSEVDNAAKPIIEENECKEVSNADFKEAQAEWLISLGSEQKEGKDEFKL